MPTQIAPTPIIRGEEARKVLEESKRKPSEKSKNGARILTEMFKDMVK